MIRKPFSGWFLSFSIPRVMRSRRRWIPEGRIAKAWLDGDKDPRGEECVYRAMKWQEGDFVFRDGIYNGESEMDFPMSQLLLEFAHSVRTMGN